VTVGIAGPNTIPVQAGLETKGAPKSPDSSTPSCKPPIAAPLPTNNLGVKGAPKVPDSSTSSGKPPTAAPLPTNNLGVKGAPKVPDSSTSSGKPPIAAPLPTNHLGVKGAPASTRIGNSVTPIGPVLAPSRQDPTKHGPNGPKLGSDMNFKQVMSNDPFGQPRGGSSTVLDKIRAQKITDELTQATTKANAVNNQRQKSIDDSVKALLKKAEQQDLSRLRRGT
jgi:hypothetical protein